MHETVTFLLVTLPIFFTHTLSNKPFLIWLLTTSHTHTRLTALFPGLPGWAGTRKVKPIWTLLEQETVSGSGISWAICKSASHSRQITTPAPHHSTPPHLKYAATLPCNLSLMACFADSDVSQGSVATYARCGGIFNIRLTANLLRNLPIKIF